jgi:tetratricopeptide (TPR) repeat protein
MQLLHEEDDTPKNLEEAHKAFALVFAAPLSPREMAEAHGFNALVYLRQGDLEGNEKKKIAFYESGMEEAKAAVAADDSCADAWFFKGATVGRWAQQKGMVKALTHLGDIRGAFQAAVKRDPHHPGALLALAIIESQVPALMGGSSSGAEKHFRAVLTENPHHTRGMLDLAEFLMNDDRKPEAIQWAKKARDETAPAFPGEWRKFDKARANALLKQMGAS